MTRAYPLRPNATPAATPLFAGPVALLGAVPVSMVIQNLRDDDRLLGASTPVAARVELHTTRRVSGERVMVPVSDGINIPAGATIVLEPAASHLMLLGPSTDLMQGETFPLTLRFAHAGEATVTVRVRRKVDAAGVAPIPPLSVGDLVVSLASAPPAPAATP